MHTLINVYRTLHFNLESSNVIIKNVVKSRLKIFKSVAVKKNNVKRSKSTPTNKEADKDLKECHA